MPVNPCRGLKIPTEAKHPPTDLDKMCPKILSKRDANALGCLPVVVRPRVAAVSGAITRVSASCPTCVSATGRFGLAGPGGGSPGGFKRENFDRVSDHVEGRDPACGSVELKHSEGNLVFFVLRRGRQIPGPG
jgi:hypothetical protein